MRNSSSRAVNLLIAMLLAAIPATARSDDEAAGRGPAEVKVLIAVAEPHFNTGSAVRVIIQNVSGKPQGHFDEWNSWGYGNLVLQWTDSQGNKGTVTKVPRGWDRNAPTTTVLKPGQALVRDISFDPKLWQGWPVASNETKLTVKVTYHATFQPRVPPVKGYEPGWTGTVTSEEQEITVYPAMPAGAAAMG